MTRYYRNRASGAVFEEISRSDTGVFLRPYGASCGGIILHPEYLHVGLDEIEKPTARQARVTFYFRGEAIYTVELPEPIGSSKADFIKSAYHQARLECPPQDAHRVRKSDGFIIQYPETIQ